MVDLRSEAILVRQPDNGTFKDKTTNILDYRQFGKKFQITFKGSRKVYSYGQDRILVLRASGATPLGDAYRVEVDGVMWESGIEICRFVAPGHDWSRIFYRAGNGEGNRIYPTSRVRLIQNGAREAEASAILQYWRNLAALLPEDSQSIRSAYQKLDFVREDSCLNRFLHAQSIDARDVDTGAPLIFPFRTNLSQRQAVRNALSYPISVIDGPPGTGKTQTILNLVANIVQDPTKTVAIVSLNNRAVDNVYEKLEQAGFGYLAANLGKKEKQEEFFNLQNARNAEVDQLLRVDEQQPSNQQLDRIDGRLQRLQGQERELAQLQLELGAYELERRHFQEYLDREQVPELGSLPLLNRSADKVLDFIAETGVERSSDSGFRGMLKRISRYFKYGPTGSLDPGDTDVVLRLQRTYYDKKIASLHQRKNELSADLDSANFSELVEQQRRLSEARLRSALRDRYAGRSKSSYERRSFRKNFSYFASDYPVILSTCHSLGQSIGNGHLLDHVIIDEASQVDLLAGGLALANCRNLVVVGDLRQLSHIPGVSEQECPPAPDRHYDYREHSILSALIKLYGGSLAREMLREHYRCEPDIIGFCNKKFYDSQLIPFTESRSDAPSMIVHRTEPGNHMRQHESGGGKSNRREIEAISHEVIPHFCGGTDRGDIGVTTPYRRQADKVTDDLFAAIENAGAELGTIQADTVHKFQGREKETIIMSTVLDESRQANFGMHFADDPQMINVAVSRAQRKFIIIIINHSLLPRSRNIRDLIGYIRYQYPDAEISASSIVSVFDLLYRDYSKRLESLAGRLRNRTSHRSENIIWTVLEDILQEEPYAHLKFTHEILLQQLLPDTNRLTGEQHAYVKRRASVDFAVYNQITRQLCGVIEVDGFRYHEDNPEQLVRDRRKNDICREYKIPLLRLSTTGSGEEERIRGWLDENLDSEVRVLGSL